MISSYLPVFPWQRQMYDQNFKHVFMHNDFMSLYCVYSSMTTRAGVYKHYALNSLLLTVNSHHDEV